MTDADDALSRLFREGTAPDRDEAFAARVLADVVRMRRRATMMLAVRLAAAFGALAVLALVASRLAPRMPDLSSLYGGREILSVPVPLVIMAVALGIGVQVFGELKRRGVLGMLAR